MADFEPWYQLARGTLQPPVALWFNWHLEGLENVSAEGPVLAACNHISYFDPLAHAYFMIKAGRRPRFLAKSELFDHLALGPVLRGAHQIPVERGSGSLAPVRAAIEAIKGGEAVLVYPEATITRNPDFTPMEGKTGVARLSLATGVPVLPVAVWGSQHIWQREGVRSLAFGRPIWLRAGPPIDLSRFRDSMDDPKVLREATDLVMDELGGYVADLRAAYPGRWNRRPDG